MSSPPLLFDPKAFAQRHARRTVAGSFLHEIASVELQERLKDINRTFQDILLVTDWPEIWRPAFPTAQIVPVEDTLAITPASADLVIHAMALHRANDPLGQIIQCHRALRPDGVFLAALIGGESLSDLRRVLAEAEIAVTGGLSPRVIPMPELRDLGALLQRAGLALPVADSHIQSVAYRDLMHLMHDLRQMGEGNALMARLRYPTRRAVFDLAAKAYTALMPPESDTLLVRFELIFLTGWAPHETQQKPLQPGTATHRLADALGSQVISDKEGS